MKPTLVIMAAGMGSRYGGLKQIDPVGPTGEIIIDYSMYDAIAAGFGKIVFVIRHYFEDAFRAKIAAKIEKAVETAYAFQELDACLGPYQCPAEREKPWGTGHAILVAKDVVKEPFAVIEACFLLIYTAENLEGIKQENIDMFGEMNGVYNALPYWREYVQDHSPVIQ